ncbi:hypothetical protein [Psychrobacter sp. PSP]|uniref:hypothetical protein n=1 Tax=Psychrobacter sp. PSP TaxID=2734636 RepID=UPI0020954BE1|nr:hypothetical protein [Psychrobacter sp. PSP]
MAKFMKIGKSLINVNNIVSTSVVERVNEYNSSCYWCIHITLSNGSSVLAATAETKEEIDQLNSELYEELKRLTD